MEILAKWKWTGFLERFSQKCSKLTLDSIFRHLENINKNIFKIIGDFSKKKKKIVCVP